MNAIMRFFKSPMGKFVIVAIALIIVGVIVMKQYEKKMYNGMSKSDVAEEIARQKSVAAINYVKANDQNYLNGAYPLEEILLWYEANRLESLADLDATSIKLYLSSLGVDFVKYPKTLNVFEDANEKMSYLKYV